jgi:hypothetical protein
MVAGAVAGSGGVGADPKEQIASRRDAETRRRKEGRNVIPVPRIPCAVRHGKMNAESAEKKRESAEDRPNGILCALSLELCALCVQSFPILHTERKIRV